MVDQLFAAVERTTARGRAPVTVLEHRRVREWLRAERRLLAAGGHRPYAVARLGYHLLKAARSSLSRRRPARLARVPRTPPR